MDKFQMYVSKETGGKTLQCIGWHFGEQGWKGDSVQVGLLLHLLVQKYWLEWTFKANPGDSQKPHKNITDWPVWPERCGGLQGPGKVEELDADLKLRVATRWTRTVLFFLCLGQNIFKPHCLCKKAKSRNHSCYDCILNMKIYCT